MWVTFGPKFTPALTQAVRTFEIGEYHIHFERGLGSVMAKFGGSDSGYALLVSCA